MSEMVAHRLSPALGAEITGVDLNQVDADGGAAIRQLLLEHLVLFFPDQDLTLDAHVALGRAFGELEIHPNLPSPDKGPAEVVELRASGGGVADEWHTDVTFLPHPSVMSIMHMVECPDIGGDTMWANQYLAFEELSEPLRDLVSGLTALHDATPHGKPEMKAIHPVVRVHPETGRRSLLVNEHFTRRIVEMSQDESDALLAFLCPWSTQERFTVRHRWQPGTVAMWDNRCTQHAVVHDFEGERVIQRVTVLGDDPTGDGPKWPSYRSGRIGAASVHDIPLRTFLAQREAEAASS
ncbi:MAG: TauD/TfdA family dioxygenase [Acidimicrobiia bacterium]|nr:TauD/TfdA family dioxygenase [Acidimicrobiia bacterium]